MKNENEYEVIIVGGSYAGLSAAMALGRASRKVLVIDSGQPCNAQTPYSHNFITQDGEKPAVIAAKAREQVKAYPTIHFLDDKALEATGTNNAFTVITSGGKRFATKKLLFATGVKDLMPAIPGFAECWGISVVHCPYCHGYEVKGEKTALMANGDTGFHLGMVLTQWTNDITLYTHGSCTLNDGQLEKLAAHNIAIVENEIVSITHKNGKMKSFTLANGEEHFYNVMYAKIPFEQHCDIPVKMGSQTSPEGLLLHDELKKTCIPGVFAAGDNTSMGRTVSMAVAAGTLAGIAINGELISDRF